MDKKTKRIELKYVCPDEYKITQEYYNFQNNPEKLKAAFMNLDEMSERKIEISFDENEVAGMEDLREVSPRLYEALHEKPEMVEGYTVSYEDDLKMKWQITKIVYDKQPIAYNKDNMTTCIGRRNTIWKEELFQSGLLSNAFGINDKCFTITYPREVLQKPLTGILLAKAYIISNPDWSWEVVNTDKGIAVWDLLTRMVKAYEKKSEQNDFTMDELSLLWEALLEPIKRKIYSFGRGSLGISYESLEYGISHCAGFFPECHGEEDAIALAYNELVSEFDELFTSEITQEGFKENANSDINEYYSKMRSKFRKKANEKYHLTSQKISEICKYFEREGKASDSAKLTLSKGEQLKFYPHLSAIMKILHDYGDMLPITVTEQDNIWKPGKYHIYENFNINKEVWESYELTRRYLEHHRQPSLQIDENEFLYQYYGFLFSAIQIIFNSKHHNPQKSEQEIDINIYQFEKIFAFYLVDKETRIICNWIEAQLSESQEGTGDFIEKLKRESELLTSLKNELAAEHYLFSKIYDFCGVYQRIEIAEKVLKDMKKTDGEVNSHMCYKKILKTKETISIQEKEYLLKTAAGDKAELNDNVKSEVHESCYNFYKKIGERIVPGALEKYGVNRKDVIDRKTCMTKAKEYLDEQGDLYKMVIYNIASPWKCFGKVIGMRDGVEEKQME